MTALRITFRKAYSIAENTYPKFRKNSTEVRASISTGPQQQHATFYEFRTYCIKPEQNTAFLKLTNEKIHLRTAHSELLGYWSVEYGGLNQAFHIWKYGEERKGKIKWGYGENGNNLFAPSAAAVFGAIPVPIVADGRRGSTESYSQRAGVRAALAKDPEWIEQYISKAMPMLTSQDNEVTYLVPWCRIERPPKEGGVYELATFQMRPGGPAVWGQVFQGAVTSHARPGYAHLVGVFHSEFGLLNRVHVLWWYENPDQRAASRHKAHGDARVVAAVRESASYLQTQSNKLLLPTPFSPLK